MNASIVIALREAMVLLTLAWVSTVSCAADGSAAWQLELRPHAPAAVFDVDKDAYLTATVRNVTGVGPDGKLVFVVTDDDAVLSSGEVTVSAAPGQTCQTQLHVGEAAILPHEQALCVTVRLIADGQEQAVWRKSLGFLPRRAINTPPETSPSAESPHTWWPT